MVYKLIPFINESSFISGSYCYKSFVDLTYLFSLGDLKLQLASFQLGAGLQHLFLLQHLKMLDQ